MFATYLHDIFREFGAIECRRMFGGYGVYHDGLMFALIHDDYLYLKADKQSESCFIELGLGRFEYQKKGGMVSLSYYAAPEDIYDDPDAALLWARRAYEAALRSRS
jgi:DNA transformation protein